jgi:hypothetical protein
LCIQQHYQQSDGVPAVCHDFSKAECAIIQATYMSTTLQKMGFMGKTKRALVFGPEEYGSL